MEVRAELDSPLAMNSYLRDVGSVLKTSWSNAILVRLKQNIAAFKIATGYDAGSIYGDRCVVYLVIPKGARVIYSGGYDLKLRTDAAYVEGIARCKGIHPPRNHRDIVDAAVPRVTMSHELIYAPGQFVYPRYKLDTNINKSCASGIHFHLNFMDLRIWG